MLFHSNANRYMQNLFHTVLHKYMQILHVSKKVCVFGIRASAIKQYM